MQKSIAIIMLLAWGAFLVLHHLQVVHTLHAGTHTCALFATPEPTPSDCCSKLHGHQGETKDCAPTNDASTEKDCCGHQGCARTCCTTTLAIMMVSPSAQEVTVHFIPTHTTLYPHTHLPTPFIGIDTPPPNA